MATKAGETPMMTQYRSFKKKYPDAILLFRVGDFYETFADDAIEMSTLVGITLTKRGNGGATDIPLAGFPYHALDTYLPKLVAQGKRVAICDQVEDPKLTNKLVKRDITELVTPGLTMQDTVLDADTNNFLASAVFASGRVGVAFLDLSTGEFITAQGRPAEMEKLCNNFSPRETLVKKSTESEALRLLGEHLNLYPLDEWIYTEDYGRERLLRHFQVKHLKGFGIEEDTLSIQACGAILYYLEATKHSRISHITSLQKIEESRFLQLDRFTLRNLEILEPLTPDGVPLADILDKTLTPMGGRLLKRWLVFPLLDTAEIRKRQEAVKGFVLQTLIFEKIGDLVSGLGDLERLSSKVAVGRINPREVLMIAASLRLIRPIIDTLASSSAKELGDLALRLDALESLATEIENTINPDTPAQIGRGGEVIRSGVSPELDDLRAVAGGGKEYLINLRNRESERTGIPSLKVAFNNVFGYYIEVRNAYKDKVPEEWIRKQTLVSAERYITQELKEYEAKILGAEERMEVLETELYSRLVSTLSSYITALQKDAQTLSEIDVLRSFAETALQNKYCLPEVDDSTILDIKGGRHPVIERLMPPGEVYIDNDVTLDPADTQIIIVTGPNMAGKSALLRQTALITLMAQVGSYVPAGSARIGIVDRIFTRVGASDNISRGESTFMTEMTEAATILNNLTPRSLILIDELGRGTSTYDGISLAQAIVEYLHDHPRAHAKTLFATHYHELNELAGYFPRVKNFNVTVREEGGKVIFLRKLEPGGSRHSFGIHVAKMAGMPRSIVDRAEDILSILEDRASEIHGGEASGSDGKRFMKGAKKKRRVAYAIPEMGPVQLSFFELEDPKLSKLKKELLDIDLNRLTPLEALNKLSALQSSILED